MATKERIHSGDDCPENDPSIKRNPPVVLSAEESASLYQSLASSPKPLSPEVKNAIANYRRIKARRT